MTIEELRKSVESKGNPVVINKGITPLPLLGIAFIVLKLIGYINWSWWWVLAPFWIPVCLALLLLGIIGIIIMIIAKQESDELQKAKQQLNKDKEIVSEQIDEYNKKSRKDDRKNSTRKSKKENV